ncbi:Hypothetical predicted protein [Scomber scombrus]|uniref:Uncharacterized protein n=1 Tax=Scomber scombrus TaxID=13677 RepID=A0AAV1QK12_SCOSC
MRVEVSQSEDHFGQKTHRAWRSAAVAHSGRHSEAEQSEHGAGGQPEYRRKAGRSQRGETAAEWSLKKRLLYGLLKAA